MIEAWNGREALVKVVREILHRGTRVAPRGQPTCELLHPTVMIENPYDVLCTGIGANQSSRVCAAEAVQMIGGVTAPRFAVKHVPKLADFLNERGEFDGAYGPRVQPQYADLVKRLTGDPDTRQAILTVWVADDLYRPTSRDYPCTLNLGFMLRDGRLVAHVTMRSNDVNWGLKNDLFVFTQLQLSLANVLGVEAGPYYHTAYSMHLYDRDETWAEGLLDEKGGAVYAKIPNHPEGIGGRDVGEMMTRAVKIIAGGYLLEATMSERWYLEQLA